MANVVKKESTNVVKETKSQEGKKMTKNETKAEVKVSFITIQEATQLYAEAGIKCKNPEAKGAYRIMSGGSSLNIKPKKGYYIYSTNDDYMQVASAGLKSKDLIVEEGTNAQDKTRPNTIICTTVETLKELLKIYAMNPLNQVTTVEVIASVK